MLVSTARHPRVPLPLHGIESPSKALLLCRRNRPRRRLKRVRGRCSRERRRSRYVATGAGRGRVGGGNGASEVAQVAPRAATSISESGARKEAGCGQRIFRFVPEA